MGNIGPSDSAGKLNAIFCPQALTEKSENGHQNLSELDANAARISKTALPERVSQFVATKGTQLYTGGRKVYFSGTNADYLLDPNVTQITDIKRFLKVRNFLTPLSIKN